VICAKQSPQALARRRAHLAHMIAQAQFIGWPALEASFRRDLRRLQDSAKKS